MLDALAQPAACGAFVCLFNLRGRPLHGRSRHSEVRSKTEQSQQFGAGRWYCRSGWRRIFSEPSAFIRSNDALLEDEAAIKATLAGLDDAVSLFRGLVERKSLDSAHGRGA